MSKYIIRNCPAIIYTHCCSKHNTLCRLVPEECCVVKIMLNKYRKIKSEAEKVLNGMEIEEWC